jgi:hypothetical protein
MADSVVFSQQQAQRIWAAVRQMEQIGRRETGYDRKRPATVSEESVLLYNESDVIIPPYGVCVAINYRVGRGSGFNVTSNGAVVSVIPADQTSHQRLLDDVSVIFNSSLPIAPKQFGKAQTSKIIIVRFRGNVPPQRGLLSPYDSFSQSSQFIEKPVLASLSSEPSQGGTILESLKDPFSLVYYDRIEDVDFSGSGGPVGDRRIQSVPVCRIIAEVQKFDNFKGVDGQPSSELTTEEGEVESSLETPQEIFSDNPYLSFFGSKGPVPPLDESDSKFVRYCIAERVDIQETPIFGIVKVNKEENELPPFSLGPRPPIRGTLIYTDNFYRFYALDTEGDQPIVEVVFDYDFERYFPKPVQEFGTGQTFEVKEKNFLCILAHQGVFGSSYQSTGPDLEKHIASTWRCIEAPVPFDCGDVKACLEDEDFDFCDLVAGCLDDEDFLDLICEKVKECLGLEEDEDIDDRIDQRLQELCTCETFIDGVSIEGNDWVFTTNEICYVACPDGGGGAGDSIIIEGTDCPEDEPGDPEP